MTQVACLEVSPFAENTYVVYDSTGEAALVDPGCYTSAECDWLVRTVEQLQVRPKRMLLTHAHLDHVFGVAFVYRRWGLLPECHRNELPLLKRYPDICVFYGLPRPEPAPLPTRFLQEGETITFGQTQLEVRFTPGHSPGGLSFYCPEAGFVLAGDTLFYESIGRTDLPGGHFETLLESIRKQLFTLPDETKVYSGHGPATTIRHEREHNPFLRLPP
ncbi:MAG: MBL fold metallo-hydrolase [Saprospiraceae bacterium]|nr:MBL fold metallo-hydrolase [Saprospiraceae bacterium]MDW8484336.1 MBL fold metallo-hydrolase [Saprospiraceae bacterium]